MTKFLVIVFKTVIVVLDVISIPVRFLITIICGTGMILFAKFIKKIDIGFKETYSILFDRIKEGLKNYRNDVVKLYEED